MNKKIMIVGVVGVLAGIGVIAFFINRNQTTVSTVSTAVGQNQTASVASSASNTNTVPLMQSTGALFSQYKYFSKAHEVFSTLAADTKTAMGAFSYTKTDLGNGTYQITLTNNAEDYKGQSVFVGAGQSVYFIEPFKSDDSASEDSITTDDSLVVVDAQGYILK